MKLHQIRNPDDLRDVAERMWEIVQEHKPEQKETMDKAVADERLDRDDVMHLGFTFGVAFCLSEFAQGHIREANDG